MATSRPSERVRKLRVTGLLGEGGHTEEGEADGTTGPQHRGARREPAANEVNETADRVHAVDQDPDLEGEPAPVRLEALDREREGGLAGTEQT